MSGRTMLTTIMCRHELVHVWPFNGLAVLSSSSCQTTSRIVNHNIVPQTQQRQQRRTYVDDGHRTSSHLNRKSAKWRKQLKLNEEAQAQIQSRLAGIPGYDENHNNNDSASSSLELEEEEQVNKNNASGLFSSVFSKGHHIQPKKGVAFTVEEKQAVYAIMDEHTARQKTPDKQIKRRCTMLSQLLDRHANATVDILDVVKQFETLQNDEELQLTKSGKTKKKRLNNKTISEHFKTRLYTTALIKLLRLRDYAQAEWLVEHMWQRQNEHRLLRCDNLAFHAAIQLYDRLGDKAQQVIQWHELAQKQKRKLSNQVPMCVFRAYHQLGQWDEAYTYFEKLKHDPLVRITHETFEAMLMVSARAGQDKAVWDLLEEYQGFAGALERAPVMCNQLVQAFVDGGHYLLAMDMAQYMCENEYSLTEATVQCLVLNDEKVDRMVQTCVEANDPEVNQRTYDFLHFLAQDMGISVDDEEEKQTSF